MPIVEDLAGGVAAGSQGALNRDRVDVGVLLDRAGRIRTRIHLVEYSHRDQGAGVEVDGSGAASGRLPITGRSSVDAGDQVYDAREKCTIGVQASTVSLI